MEFSTNCLSTPIIKLTFAPQHRKWSWKVFMKMDVRHRSQNARRSSVTLHPKTSPKHASPDLLWSRTKSFTYEKTGQLSSNQITSPKRLISTDTYQIAGTQQARADVIANNMTLVNMTSTDVSLQFFHLDPQLQEMKQELLENLANSDHWYDGISWSFDDLASTPSAYIAGGLLSMVVLLIAWKICSKRRHHQRTTHQEEILTMEDRIPASWAHEYIRSVQNPALFVY